MNDGTLIYMPLERGVVSPLNPRKTLNAASIDETAESIISVGVIQPPLCRLGEDAETLVLHEGLRYLSAGTAELLSGQRRFLSSRRAVDLARERELPAKFPERLLPDGTLPRCRADELTWLAVITRVITDVAAEELMLVENLHREEVSPREEAEGYARLLELLDDHGGKLYTMETLAAKIGKSKAYVIDRLKLRSAPQVMWDAYEAGKIGTKLMELVGRIPHPKQREAAAKRILTPKMQDHPLTFIQAVELVKSEFMTSLSGCGFDQADAGLLQIEHKDGERVMGGACSDCPYRTGNDPELRAELRSEGRSGGKSGIDRNLCLNPLCFAAKQEAVWRKTKANAENTGTRVLDVDRTGDLFEPWGNRVLRPSSGLVDLSARPGYEATGNHASEDTSETWDELLSETDAVKSVIIARHPETKRLHRLVELETAVKAAESKLKEEGKPNLFANRPQKQKKLSGAGTGGGKEAGELQAKRKVRDLTRRLFFSRVEDAMKDPTVKRAEHEMWGVLLKLAFLSAALESMDEVQALLGVTDEEVTGMYDGEELWEVCGERLKARAKGGNELPMVVVLLVMSVILSYEELDGQSTAKELATALKLDLGQLRAQAERTVNAELSPSKESKKKDGGEQPHVGRHYKTAVTKDFAELLMTVSVPAMTPNENDVFTDPPTVWLTKGKRRVAISLACDEQGWYTGYKYTGEPVLTVNAGGGNPNCSHDRHPTRKAAVLAELRSLTEHLSDQYKSLIPELKAAMHLVELSGAEDEAAFHCDCCGKVCAVPPDQVEKVTQMEEGSFLCTDCDPRNSFFPLLSADEQAQYEQWNPQAEARARQIEQDEAERPALQLGNAKRRAAGKPAMTMEEARAVRHDFLGGAEREQLKERCRQWRAGNPGYGAAAMADELGLDVDEAFSIVDELIDEEYAAQQGEEIMARPDPKKGKGKDKK